MVYRNDKKKFTLRLLRSVLGRSVIQILFFYYFLCYKGSFHEKKNSSISFLTKKNVQKRVYKMIVVEK